MLQDGDHESLARNKHKLYRRWCMHVTMFTFSADTNQPRHVLGYLANPRKGKYKLHSRGYVHMQAGGFDA